MQDILSLSGGSPLDGRQMCSYSGGAPPSTSLALEPRVPAGLAPSQKGFPLFRAHPIQVRVRPYFPQHKQRESLTNKGDEEADQLCEERGSPFRRLL